MSRAGAVQRLCIVLAVVVALQYLAAGWMQSRRRAVASAPSPSSGGSGSGSGPRIRTVCIISADFWGLPTAGGTATAFELQAKALAQDTDMNVVLVGAPMPSQFEHEERALAAHAGAPANLSFEFLNAAYHINLTSTHPLESTGMAVLEWVKRNQWRCDVVHGHEWGGAMAATVTFASWGGLRPGLPIVVQEHGGHFWSSQNARRPDDVYSLRIDAHEKVAIELADAVTAPTAYMLDWYAQRGWALPPATAVVANVIQDDAAAAVVREKPVWRVVFFGRLEERKGLKIFMAAVQQLPLDVTSHPDFQVVFLGAEASVDGMTSTEWLRQEAERFTWSYVIHANAPHDRAMEIINQEGNLLVLTTMVDNAPYVAIESCIQHVPFLIFDVGGVSELISATNETLMTFHGVGGSDSASSFESNVRSVVDTLTVVLRRGSAFTAAVRSSYANGAEQWREWHRGPAAQLVARTAAKRRYSAAAACQSCAPLAVYNVTHQLPAMELHDAVCRHGGSDADNVLLLPESYRFDPGPNSSWSRISHLFGADFAGAVTFGALTPAGGRAAFPTSPTWQLYHGLNEQGWWEDACADLVPLLLKRHTFCTVHRAAARNFPRYSSWLLALLLKQAGEAMQTFPEVVFTLERFNQKGSGCMMDKLPALRLDHQTADNMRKDPQLYLLERLSPHRQALSDFVADLEDPSRASPWTFNTGDSPTALERMRPLPSSSAGGPSSAVYTCADSAAGANATDDLPKPYYNQQLLHPCASAGNATGCCGRPTSAAHIALRSWFDLDQVLVIITYEVWPKCGDGVTIAISVQEASGQTHELHRKVFAQAEHAQRQRQRLLLPHVAAGSEIVFSVYAGETDECDGVYLAEWQVWRVSDAQELALT